MNFREVEPKAATYSNGGNVECSSALINQRSYIIRIDFPIPALGKAYFRRMANQPRVGIAHKLQISYYNILTVLRPENLSREINSSSG